jgi:hypothetical protein
MKMAASRIRPAAEFSQRHVAIQPQGLLRRNADRTGDHFCEHGWIENVKIWSKCGSHAKSEHGSAKLPP